MLERVVARYFLLAGIVFLISTVAAAQSDRASVRGMVSDPSGAAVAAAAVRVTNESTGEVRNASADGEGRFVVPMLAPGAYQIEVTQTGRKKQVTRAQLRVNQELWLDVQLTLGDVREEIVVTASDAPVDRESAALGAVIDSRQVAALPLDGRNFLELSLLVPGAVPAPQGSASSLRGDFAFSINGAREDQHSFLLDGLYNVDPKLNTPGVRPAVDGIREFEVLTSTYDASFGRNSAGQINVVTRSGGNALHGTAYGFARTNALEARNYFAPRNEPSPDYSRQQFGGSLGGPIARDRTFFFGDYEHTRLREGITRVTNVPTALERSGNFSQSLFATPIDPTTGQPFTGGVVPSFFMNPVGQAIAALYPLPNRSTPFANFVSSPTLRDDVDLFDTRIDHNLGGGATLAVRYSFNDRRFFEPMVGLVSVPGYGTDVPRRAQNLGVSYTLPFGPRFVNETRVGYSRVSIGVFQQGLGTSLNRQVGLPEVSSNARDFGLSQISVTGYSPIGDEYTSPQEGSTDMAQVLDTLTWSKGAHMLKAGFDWRYVRQGAYRDVQSRGFLTFSDRYVTGNALADLLLGYPLVTGAATLNNPQQLRSNAWGAFLQDNWRLNSNLSLNLGLRYEYVAPAVDDADRANLYDASTGQLVQVGTGTMPRGGFVPDRNNWAPRVGFAWTPDMSGRTVVHGGYGIYFNQGALATGEGLYFNAPYFNFRLFVPFTGVPPVTLQDPFPQSYPIVLPQSATGYQRDLKTGWSEQWSASIQRVIGRRRSIEAAYVATRGHNLIAARDLNQPAPSAAPVNLRPNPLFDDITFIESRGSSRYNALQLRFQQQFDRGISALASYTFGKSSDNASGFFASAGDPNFPQDSRSPAAEWARSSFDVRHRFSLSVSGELPFGRNRMWLRNGTAGKILSDMELQSIVTLQSGRPFTVALLPEFDNSNTGRSTLGFGANDRPNVAGVGELANPTPDRWFNTSAFSIPTFGTFGNLGRNSLSGPGYQNVNLALLKHIDLTDRVRLQLRAEAFNLLNHPNFNLPDAFLGSPTYGRIVSADSPRRCQFGIRAIF